MTKDAWVGVDVAIAKRKRLPIVICTREDERLVPLDLRLLPNLVPPMGIGNARVIDGEVTSEFAKSAQRYVEDVAKANSLNIRGIGIDAPCNYANEQTSRRAAEAAVNRAGISCFATPTKSQFGRIVEKAHQHLEKDEPVSRLPHANQLWMLAGFALFDELSKIAECREVYPQATVQVLGAGDVYKTRKTGLINQSEAVAAHTGWPANIGELDSVGFGARHDNLDSYLAAWVASLDESRLHAFGNPPDDVIWVPKVGSAKFDMAIQQDSADRKQNSKSDHAKLCPACHKHRFKRWPWGWDAHAAYRCTGLVATEPEARKQEFRDRFM